MRLHTHRGTNSVRYSSTTGTTQSISGTVSTVRRQNELIDRYGWAVTVVFPTEDRPGAPFAYTIGLTAYHHPELIIAGLDARLSQQLLNDLATRFFQQAQRFTAGQRISDLLAGYDAIIVEGPPTDDLYPGHAIARYGKDRVRLQQVVWPDQHGRFPWEPGYAINRQAQPVLNRP